MTRRDSQSDRGTPEDQKPSVPLEEMVDRQPQGAETDAADDLGSEAAKAPPPEVESPAEAEPPPSESVVDLTENKRRQRTE